MQKASRITVAVLSGGIGSEREVSIESGKHVASALRQAGYNVINSDIRPDALDILDDRSVDVFFPALHGEFGEDGQLQQILEDRGLRYVGCGPDASRIAFDKVAAKQVICSAGVSVPRHIRCDSADAVNLEGISADSADKYVIKPIRQGSSVGVSIVDQPEKVRTVVAETVDRFGPCIVEQFITGRELTVGILDGKALPIIEIRPKTKFYDYSAKYVDDQTEFAFDTIEDAATVRDIQTAAVQCFEAIGGRHFSRVDFILSSDRMPYALEVNTIPGFTSHSLLPKAAARAGVSMSEMCSKVVNLAVGTGS